MFNEFILLFSSPFNLFLDTKKPRGFSAFLNDYLFKLISRDFFWQSSAVGAAEQQLFLSAWSFLANSEACSYL